MVLDIHELENENERLSKENSDFLSNFVKMPEKQGVVIVRLLPPAKAGMFDRERNKFFVSTRTHKLNGRNYHCMNEISNGRWEGDCPICKYYKHLWKESEKVGDIKEAERLQSLARQIKPIERYYYNVIVRKQTNENGDVEENVGPKILSIGKTLHQMIVRAIVGDKELEEKPLGDVSDIVSGRDFKIVKQIRQSGKDFYPNYSESRFVNEPSPLGNKDQVRKWLEELHDLQSLRDVKDFDELKKQLKIHLGVIPDDVSDDGFDPSEFSLNPSSRQTSQVEQPSREKTDSSTSVEKVQEDSSNNDDDSELLADDDLIKELKGVL